MNKYQKIQKTKKINANNKAKERDTIEKKKGELSGTRSDHQRGSRVGQSIVHRQWGKKPSSRRLVCGCRGNHRHQVRPWSTSTWGLPEWCALRMLDRPQVHLVGRLFVPRCPQVLWSPPADQTTTSTSIGTDDIHDEIQASRACIQKKYNLVRWPVEQIQWHCFGSESQ